jgi:hypothetical protein
MTAPLAKVIDAHVLHPEVYARTVNRDVVSGFGARPMEEHPTPDSPRWAALPEDGRS